MIKYNLKCHNNHEFESWFSHSSEFEKLNLIHDALKRGKTCLYSDPDVVFLKNPMDYLKELMNDYDMVIQSNADDTKRK